MIMWVNTEHQLRECPFGDFVLSFAETHSPRLAKWELRSVRGDLGDDHLYHAEFDIPSWPGSRLTFTFRVDGSKPGPPDVDVLSGEFTVKKAPQT